MGEIGGLMLYLYAENNGINLVDPDGRISGIPPTDPMLLQQWIIQQLKNDVQNLVDSINKSATCTALSTASGAVKASKKAIGIIKTVTGVLNIIPTGMSAPGAIVVPTPWGPVDLSGVLGLIGDIDTAAQAALDALDLAEESIKKKKKAKCCK